MRGLSHTRNKLEEAAKRADLCLGRSVGYFSVGRTENTALKVVLRLLELKCHDSV